MYQWPDSIPIIGNAVITHTVGHVVISWAQVLLTAMKVKVRMGESMLRAD